MINRNHLFLKLSFIFILFLSFSYASAATYYVSNTDGNDTCTGLSETAYTTGVTACPIKTLTKLNTKTFSPGDSILFKKGDTFYGSITVSQSGTSGNPITFSSYGTSNEKPIITGFTDVTLWTNLGNNIWESVNTIPILESTNKPPDTPSIVNVVTVNNVSIPKGRWPNADASNGGYVTFQSHTGSTSITSSSLTGTPNWTGAEVVVRSSRWTLAKSNITSQSGGTIVFNPSINYEPVNGFGFFIQNDIRTLDVQNEWYYNPSTKKISIYSTSQPSNVKVSSVDYLVEYVGNLSNVTAKGNYTNFDGISFWGANRSAFYVWKHWWVKLNNINIKNSDILYTGMDAISMESSYINVENNNISYTNGTSISVGPARDNVVVNSNSIVRNNFINNNGLIKGAGSSYAGISVGSNTTVENNNVINSGYIGISFYGNSINIKNNFVDTFCSILDDGGGIYTYSGNGRALMNDIKVEGNIVINGVGATEGTNDSNYIPVNGIYLDNFSKNVEVSNNTVENMPSLGIFLHDASNINVHDNTSYNNETQFYSNYYGAVEDSGNLINNNIFVSKNVTQNVVQYRSSYNNNVMSLRTFDSNYYIRPFNNINIIHTTAASQNDYRTLEAWQTYSGQDLNSHKSPININLNTLNNTIGSNIFTNGNFNTNITGASCWNAIHNCTASWDSNKLDGGSFKITFDSRVPAENTLLTIPIGPISSGKNYVLKYSFVGSTDIHNTYSIYLRKLGSPYNYLTPASSRVISSSRSENEIIFTTPTTESNAAILFEIKKTDSTNNTVWFDNIEFYEANITTTNPDDHIFFDYNASTSSKTVTLPWPVVDMDGVKHTGSITILPYSSVIYLKDPNPTVVTPPSDSTAPTISSFSIPTTSTTLTISPITLSATDTSGIGGYLLNETGTTPNAGSGPWQSTSPTTHTFTTAGTKTLYAFAKDTNGNVSTPSSDTITITLPVVVTPSGGGGGGGGYTPPPTTTITCPTGSTLVGTTCITNLTCPTGTTLINNNCINNITNLSTPPVNPTPNPVTTPSYTFTTRMTLGTKGTEVLKLQEILISKGYLTGTADGSYGPKTLTAVKAFQRAFNLTPDGIIGIQGRAILNNTTITPTYTPTTPTLPTTSLLTDKLVFRSKANNISQVKLLQTILTSKGYPLGTIDGIFGRGTLSAVKSFQLSNNLTPDGIVGAKSRELLNK